MFDDQTTYIIYDGECPFCSRYVRLLRLREAIGVVELVNARSNHPLLQRLQDKGIDLDEGMALIQGNQIKHGAECIHALSLLSTPANLFNRFNARMFRSPVVSKLLYPLLRSGRNAALRVLGREKLAAEK